MAIIITTLCEMYLRGAYGRDPDAVLTEKSVAPLSPATFIRQTLSLEVGLRLIRGDRRYTWEKSSDEMPQSRTLYKS